jgi:hypothetical protein
VVQPRQLALGTGPHGIEDLDKGGAHDLPLGRAITTGSDVG